MALGSLAKLKHTILTGGFMKFLKFFALISALILLLASCNRGTTDTSDSTTDSEITENEVTETMPQKEYLTKTISLKDAEALIKPLGRAYYLDSLLTADHAASGFEASLDCKGDVSLAITTANDVKFAITVDGVERKNVTVPAGSSELVIATGLEEGLHRISIINETGFISGSKVDMTKLTFTGELLAVSSDSKTPYIEFIGDSISAGYGLSQSEGNNHDSTLAYPYLTAKLLGADYTILARSGLGVAYSAGASNIFENVYPYASDSRGKAPYAPTRTPDLVVINLHTNDNYQWYSKGGNKEGDYYNMATFDAKFDNIIKTRAATYGDVPMIFVFGCMASPNWTLATDRSIELLDGKYTEEGYDVAYVILPTDRSGVESHPSAAGAEKQAQALCEYIKENYPEVN